MRRVAKRKSSAQPTWRRGQLPAWLGPEAPPPAATAYLLFPKAPTPQPAVRFLPYPPWPPSSWPGGTAPRTASRPPPPPARGSANATHDAVAAVQPCLGRDRFERPDLGGQRGVGLRAHSLRPGRERIIGATLRAEIAAQLARAAQPPHPCAFGLAAVPQPAGTPTREPASRGLVKLARPSSALRAREVEAAAAKVWPIRDKPDSLSRRPPVVAIRAAIGQANHFSVAGQDGAGSIGPPQGNALTSRRRLRDHKRAAIFNERSGPLPWHEPAHQEQELHFRTPRPPSGAAAPCARILGCHAFSSCPRNAFLRAFKPLGALPRRLRGRFLHKDYRPTNRRRRKLSFRLTNRASFIVCRVSVVDMWKTGLYAVCDNSI